MAELYAASYETLWSRYGYQEFQNSFSEVTPKLAPSPFFSDPELPSGTGSAAGSQKISDLRSPRGQEARPNFPSTSQLPHVPRIKSRERLGGFHPLIYSLRKCVVEGKLCYMAES